MASLTEAAKAVLEGRTLEEGATLPTPGSVAGGVLSVAPGHRPDNTGGVDMSTVSTGNAKTLRPSSKHSEGRFANPKAAPATLGYDDLDGATPTEVADENLGAKASGKVGKDSSRSGQSSMKAEPMKKMAAMAEEMEDEGDVVYENEEQHAEPLASRIKRVKKMTHDLEEAKKMKKHEDDEDEDEKMEKCDEELELSEELEDFIAEAIEAGLDEEEIMEAIDDNFEFISEEEELDEISRELAYNASDKAAAKARKFSGDDGSARSKVGGKIAKEYMRQSDKFAKYGNKKYEKDLVDRDKASTSGAKKRRLGLEEEMYEDSLEDYQVDMSEHVEALLEGEDLSEEFHAKATTIFEAAVKSKLEEEVALLEQAYAETLEERVNEIMEELASNVDDYLNYVVEQWIEENEVAVESALRSELTEDFISGLRSLFAEHYIDIPEEEVPVVEELSQTVEELEAALNEEIEQNVRLSSMLSESRKVELTSEICEGLTSTQAAKLKVLAEGVDYASDEEFIEKVATLRENYFPTSVRTDEVLDRVESSDPQTITEENLDGRMAAYAKALGRSLPK